MIDLNRPVADNVRAVAESFDRQPIDITALVLDRPRHHDLVEELRAAGTRIKLIGDGTVTASISAAVRGTNDHLSIGIGGTRQAVLSAAALRCLGGGLQAQLWPTSRSQIESAHEAQLKGLKKFTPQLYELAVEGCARFFGELGAEVERVVASLGFERAQDLVGRSDLLVQARGADRVDLEVHQVWRIQFLVATEKPLAHSLAARRAQQELEDGAGIHDDHRASRSRRTARAGESLVLTGVRFESRSTSSCSKGRAGPFQSSTAISWATRGCPTASSRSAALWST